MSPTGVEPTCGESNCFAPVPTPLLFAICLVVADSPPVATRSHVAVPLPTRTPTKQVGKHALAGRVVDARNPGRKLTKADQTMDLDAEYSRYEVRREPTALFYFPRAFFGRKHTFRSCFEHVVGGGTALVLVLVLVVYFVGVMAMILAGLLCWVGASSVRLHYSFICSCIHSCTGYFSNVSLSVLRAQHSRGIYLSLA